MITEEQKDHLRLWVSTLRKTRSKQAKGVLCKLDDNRHIVGYCCLGIACNVYKKETGKGNWNKNKHKYAIFEVGNRFSTTSLSTPIMKYYGLNDTNNYITMNDSDNATFKQIADQIEKDYNL